MADNSLSVRAIAFYLPQYHPIPENDAWWGKGFTEWTNVAKARPLFKGHRQPNLPADLGFYDLRLPEVREEQAALARLAGIEGFCYWHYWFGKGRKILERPINEVLATGKPNFPFCLCWANGSWSGVWHGAPDKLLIEQHYSGAEDYTRFFYDTLPAFRDERYMTVEGKLLFVIYAPADIPDLKTFLQTFRELAHKESLPGFHFVAYDMHTNLDETGMDACSQNLPGGYWGKIPLRPGPVAFVRRQWEYRKRSVLVRNQMLPRVFSYADFVANHYNEVLPINIYPTVLPNWDNTPRSGKRGMVLQGSTPELFGIQLQKAIAALGDRPHEKRIVFIKAWNEWAEGNYLEPDQCFGNDWLNATRAVLLNDAG